MSLLSGTQMFSTSDAFIVELQSLSLSVRVQYSCRPNQPHSSDLATTKTSPNQELYHPQCIFPPNDSKQHLSETEIHRQGISTSVPTERAVPVSNGSIHLTGSHPDVTKQNRYQHDEERPPLSPRSKTGRPTSIYIVKGIEHTSTELFCNRQTKATHDHIYN